ncbi:hypothetical protein BJ508DRAFT_328087 [Ascobolus immersus RN42]|uniref:Uncharacterized protein n=1 Tax=Ascobolus immersus RN42 TaxID=1160509 RepID=A0A3N4ID41_ASCIM|nr:hypothetical protein BJ508DRAFT_328087 [Ascobolus immersus RN42]
MPLLAHNRRKDKGKEPERYDDYPIESAHHPREYGLVKQRKKPVKNPPPLSEKQKGKQPERRPIPQPEARIPGAYPTVRQLSYSRVPYSDYDEEFRDVDLGSSDVQPGSYFRRMKVIFYYPELLPISYEAPDLIHNDAGIYKVTFKDYRTGGSHAYGYFPDAEKIVGREKNIRIILYLAGTRKIMSDAIFSKKALREVRGLQVYPGLMRAT